jgi:hypothetical protein
MDHATVRTRKTTLPALYHNAPETPQIKVGEGIEATQELMEKANSIVSN